MRRYEELVEDGAATKDAPNARSGGGGSETLKGKLERNLVWFSLMMIVLGAGLAWTGYSKLRATITDELKTQLPELLRSDSKLAALLKGPKGDPGRPGPSPSVEELVNSPGFQQALEKGRFGANIGGPIAKPLGEWFQVDRDGFLVVRVESEGGAHAYAWCNDDPRKEGPFVLRLDLAGSDNSAILLARRNQHCRGEHLADSKGVVGGEVYLDFFPLELALSTD